MVEAVTRWKWRAVHVTGSATIVLALTACGRSPSMLSPHSPEARRIASTWWLMFALAVAVYIVVAALIAIAVLRRGENVDDQRRRRFENRFILIGGLVIPIAILGITAVATVVVANDLAPAAAATQPQVQITVKGEQWWWRIDYPHDGVVTANEVHVPVGRKVDITLVSDNVIHSLWVPELNGKADMIPGQVNHLRFTATKTGRFEGRCAEFCGIQHARMEFVVFVDSAQDYQDWLATNGSRTADATRAAAQRGEQLLVTSSCAGCHTVSGTPAQGVLGPDLTHIASRKTLGAGTIDNTPDGLAKWLDDTQSLKKGAHMPEVDLTAEQISDLVEYMKTLR